MAIKVKHDVNAAPVAVASTAAGRARRQMETARLMAGSGRTTGGGGTGGGGAHPIAPPTAHAQLLSAHAPTPVNWELQRRENAAQEAARLDQALRVAGANNDAAKERLKTQNDAAKERAQMGIDADAAKLKSQQDFSKAQREAEQAWREQQTENARQFSITQDEAKRKAAQEEWDRQHGILRQESEQDLLDKRAAANGYSPNAQREVDRLNKEYEDAVIGGKFSQEQLDDLRQQRDVAIAAIPKSRQKSPEEQFRESMVFGNRDNGLPEGAVFDPQTRRLVVDPNAQMELQARREERVQDRQDRLAAQEEQRYVNAYLALQKQGKMVDEMRKEFEPGEIEELLKPLFPNRFANVQPGSAGAQPVTAQPAPASANPAPTTQPTAQPTAAPTPGVKPLPQNATPQQAADYAAQFKRKKK